MKPRPDTEPSDEDLRAFVGSMLSNLDRLLREPAVVDEAIREHREMWGLLYRASAPRRPDKQSSRDGDTG